MARIFISYKRIDKTRVFEIRDLIESKIGEECWIDLEGIESDAQFKNVIIRAINQCEVVLFMYSKAHADIRDFEKDWTVRELNYASAKEKRIVFVNIDGTPLTDEFEFDFGLKQRIDGRSSDSLNRLIRDLKEWLNTSTPPPIIVNPPEPEEDANVLFEKGRHYKLSGDYSTAVKYFRKAAKQGHAPAQNSLGDMYHYGQGVTQNDEIAVTWYHKAAEQGDASAQYKLAIYYKRYKRDYSQAKKWLELAANQGFKSAKELLRKQPFISSDNPKTVSTTAQNFKRFVRNAFSPNMISLILPCLLLIVGGVGLTLSYNQNDLEYIYYNGYKSYISGDYENAVRYYRKAAEQGGVDAQLYLGLCYYEGKGVCQDSIEAKKWLELAAEQGNAEAEVFLNNHFSPEK